MQFRLVPGSGTEISHECPAQGFGHVGEAHFRCHSGVWGAYRTSAFRPVLTSASGPAVPCAHSQLSRD